MTMLAAMFYGPMDIRMEQRPIPQPGPGEGVTQCQEGDAVVVANSAPCQQCFYCKRGQYSLCENLLFLNGAYAEYLLVPERIVRQNLYKLAPGTSFVAAALTEPLACALHGIEASEIVQGDTVVILGS